MATTVKVTGLNDDIEFDSLKNGTVVKITSESGDIDYFMKTTNIDGKGYFLDMKSFDVYDDINMYNIIGVVDCEISILL